MGGAAKRPAVGGPGQVNSDKGEGLGYYRNVLNNQKEAVANVPATQAVQGQSQTPPNRPSADMPGFGNQQQGQGGDAAGFQGAYNAYINRYGGGSNTTTPQPPGAASGNQPQPGTPPPDQMRPQDNRERQGSSQRPGIRMGSGYSSRT